MKTPRRRWMFLAGAVPAVVYGWIAYTLPESPRFLVFQGKDEEALKIFQSIAPDEDTDRHLRDIKKAIEEDKVAGQKGSLRGKAFGLQPVVWIGIILSIRDTPRATLFWLIVPLYYLVFESPFLYEWRVAVPMQYFLLPFAARTLADLWARVSNRGVGHGGTGLLRRGTETSGSSR